MLNLNNNKSKVYTLQGEAFQQWAKVANKGVYTQAIHAFNQDVTAGLAVLGSPATTEEIVHFLQSSSIYLDPKQVGECLAGSTPQHQALLQVYMRSQDYTQQSYPVAFRAFLNSHFSLPGDGQQVDRLVRAFAQRYHEQNPGLFADENAVYALSFSTIMLNMNHQNAAHDQAKMSQQDFLRNNQGMNQGADFDSHLLTQVYQDICSEPLGTRISLNNYAQFIQEVLVKTSNPTDALKSFVEGLQNLKIEVGLDSYAQKLMSNQVKSAQKEALVQHYSSQVEQAKAFSTEPVVEKMLDLASRLELILKVQKHRLLMRDKRLIRELINEIQHDPSVKSLMSLPAHYDDLNQHHANIIHELNRIKDLVPQEIQRSLGAAVVQKRANLNTPHPLFHGDKRQPRGHR